MGLDSHAGELRTDLPDGQNQYRDRDGANAKSGSEHDSDPGFRFALNGEGWLAARWILQPISQRQPRDTPKLRVKLALVPPRRIPPEVQILVHLHQSAAMQNARTKLIHL